MQSASGTVRDITVKPWEQNLTHSHSMNWKTYPMGGKGSEYMEKRGLRAFLARGAGNSLLTLPP